MTYTALKFLYTVFHYIGAHCPLAHCPHIYRSMNYERVSFHRSWIALPGVQIMLKKTSTTQAKLDHFIPESSTFN